MKTTKKIVKKDVSPQIKKLKAIMKRNGLTCPKLAKILKLSSSSVYAWFQIKVNPEGNIKKIYFDKLKVKGYK